jgi:hypothetical protein
MFLYSHVKLAKCSADSSYVFRKRLYQLFPKRAWIQQSFKQFLRTQDSHRVGGHPVKNHSSICNVMIWDITPCSSLKGNRRFGETYRLHIQGPSPPKCTSTFNRLHKLISQKTSLFTAAAMSSNVCNDFSLHAQRKVCGEGLLKGLSLSL